MVAVDFAADSRALLRAELRCPCCKGAYSWREDHVHCVACARSIPLRHGEFPDFVPQVAELSPTERIEIDNLAGQARKIYRADFRDSYNLERLAAILPWIPEGVRLIDIGASDGQIGRYLQDARRLSIVGIEKSPVWLDLYGSARIPFVFTDVNRLPFADGTFDVAFMGEILEHLYDPIATLAEAVRVVRSGGSVVATVPNFFFLPKRITFALGKFSEDPSNPLRHEHIRFFSVDAVKMLTDAAGLEDPEIVGVWPEGFAAASSLYPLRRVFRATGWAPRLLAACLAFRARKP